MHKDIIWNIPVWKQCKMIFVQFHLSSRYCYSCSSDNVGDEYSFGVVESSNEISRKANLRLSQKTLRSAFNMNGKTLHWLFWALKGLQYDSYRKLDLTKFHRTKKSECNFVSLLEFVSWAGGEYTKLVILLSVNPGRKVISRILCDGTVKYWPGNLRVVPYTILADKQFRPVFITTCAPSKVVDYETSHAGSF